MKKLGVSFFTLFSGFLPVMAFAAVDANFGEIGSYFTSATTFVNNTLIPLMFAVALLFFLWGVFKYFIQGGGDEEKRADGTQLMIYAIIGFVLMISIWGIVNIIAGGLSFNDDNTVTLPNVPTRSN